MDTWQKKCVQGIKGKSMKKHYDILIVGDGAAGLFAALKLPADK